ncbi:MBL fold metallo-hydrolase [candidate division WOR-3 bacterium]|nr:MBL fold metallo-hydrolase [candidate division WOR-3 bacterium]
MNIKWLGHSCFMITSKSGLRILTDPYKSGGCGGSVGYGKIDEEADIVVVSHSHSDHNSVESVPGNFIVVKETGIKKVKGIRIKGVKTFHDDKGGSERGENIVFVIEIDGLKVCHLGDLGEVLDGAKREEIGRVDILLTPVGGHYTIDANQADEIAEKLECKIVIPMHYKTEVLDFPISSVGEFLKNKNNVEIIDSCEVEIGGLPEETKVLVLKHKL